MALRRGIGVVMAGLGSATLYRYHNVTEAERKLPKQELPVFDRQNNGIDPAKKQRVLIIGAGVVGVSTAYKLAKLGHQVAILVRRFAMIGVNGRTSSYMMHCAR